MAEPNRAEGPPRTGKSEAAFRTTGEVSEELELPAHVLRFWNPNSTRSNRLNGAVDAATTGRRTSSFSDISGGSSVRRGTPFAGFRGCCARVAYVRKPEGTTPMLLPLEPVDHPSTTPPNHPASRQALQAVLEEVRRELLEIRALLDKLLAQ